MRSKEIARIFLAFSLLITVAMVSLTAFRKGGGEGFLAFLIGVWLSAGPFSYLKDWTIPLVGPFSFDQGRRQAARFIAVCVMVFMLCLLAGHEVWLLIKKIDATS